MTLSGIWNRARRVEPRFDVGLAAVVVVSAVWTGALGTLVARRHNAYGTFDYDLGIHDQSVWLLSRGGWFSTIRGTNIWIDNMGSSDVNLSRAGIFSNFDFITSNGFDSIITDTSL